MLNIPTDDASSTAAQWQPSAYTIAPSRHDDQQQDDTTSEEPPAKRRRSRASQACDACRRRRSRCEPLVEGGCHRCKSLQTECSFIASTIVNSDSHSMPATTSTDDLPDIQEGIELSHAALRQDLRSTITQQPLSTHAPPVTVSTAVPPPLNTQTEQLQQRIMQLEAALMQSTTMPLTNPSVTRPNSDIHNFPSQSAVFDTSPQSVTNHRYGGYGEQSNPPLNLLTPGRSSETSTTRQRDSEPKSHGWYRSLADPETYGLIHRGMLTKIQEGLTDPVEAGVISEGQAEVAYQIFKHHFAAVFPHPHFLRVRSKLPSHPFLRSACLFYTSRCSTHIPIFNPAQALRLEANLVDNINAYHYGCQPSFEGVMAAYILSLIPHHWREKPLSEHELEPTRTAGLAYGQAREIGSVNFERLLQTLQSGMPIQFIEDRVNEARLHLGVITRHLWLTISRCPWSVVSPLVHKTQRELLDFLLRSDRPTEVDRHVDVEYSCLEIIMRYAITWRQLETVQTPTLAEVKSSTEVVRSLNHDLDELRSSTAATYGSLVSLPFLLCHISYCKWWVAARNVWFIYRLPTPVITNEVMDAWLEGITEGLKASAELIEVCLREKWDLTSMPKAFGAALVLCVLTISTGIIHLRHYYPEFPLPKEMDMEETLREMRNYLSTSGDGLAAMLERSKDNLEEYRLQLATQSNYETDYQDLIADSAMFGARMEGEQASNPGMMDLFSGIDTWWNWQLPTQPNFDDAVVPNFPGLFGPQ